jgi:DNA-binding PadR family transcriptional regulator
MARAPCETALDIVAIVFILYIYTMNRSSLIPGPLTLVEFEILLSLASGELHGYAVLQDIDRRTDGALNLRPGTLYRAISRLLGAGLIVETADTNRRRDDPRRRTYRMTADGRKVASAEAERLARQLATARHRKVLRRSEG